MKLLVCLLLAGLALCFVRTSSQPTPCLGDLQAKLTELLTGMELPEFQGYTRSILRMWGVEDLIAYTPDIWMTKEQFITTTFGCLVRNEIMEQYACTLRDNYPVAAHPDLRDLVKQASLHSYFLHFVNAEIKKDYTRAARVFAEIQKSMHSLEHKTISDFEFYKHASLFESGKLNLIMPALIKSMKSVLDKTPVPFDRVKCGQRVNGVSLNVGEAMLADMKNRHYDNARAAVPMMLAPNLETDNLALHGHRTHFDETHRVSLNFQPFPTEWAKLYETWNLAFTMGEYDNFPMLWAKLINPSTSCYHDVEGSYLHNRGVTLALHILFEVFWRYKVGPLHSYKLRDTAVTDRLGSHTYAASLRYKKMVDDAQPGYIKQESYDQVIKFIHDYSESPKTWRLLKYLGNQLMKVFCPLSHIPAKIGKVYRSLREHVKHALPHMPVG